jgi:formylglycine-generating enzyme required for sulfatase activity
VPAPDAGPQPTDGGVPPSQDAAFDPERGDAVADAVAEDTGTVGCTAGQVQCASNAEPQTCSSMGTWQNEAACTAGQSCVQGACVTPPTPPSCRVADGGASGTGCGPTSESCCTSLQIPGGAYNRTYSNGGSGPTAEADPATVSGFRLDKYLVTVGRFRQFVTAWNAGSGYTPPAGSGKHTHLNGGQGLPDSGSPGNYETGWVPSDDSNITPTNDNLACDPMYATWTRNAGGQENLPMNCVNWYEAYAFCIWDGGFLPSEAEFEYASAGGRQEREYPWGSTAPGTANQYAIYNCNYPDGSASCSAVTNIAPVGTAVLGAGLWGQLDLVGDMSEWNLDWNAPYVNPCTDCAFLTGGSGRVNRGGYFESSAATNLQSAFRNEGLYPTDRFQSFGLRCARTP